MLAEDTFLIEDLRTQRRLLITHAHRPIRTNPREEKKQGGMIFGANSIALKQ
jgi:hypothetical protein